MKIAAVNSWSEPMQIQKNLHGITSCIHLLEKDEVDYALFPELSVSGYLNSPELLNEFTIYYAQVLQDLLKLSEKAKLIFSVGLPMPDASGWTISQLTFAKGEIVGIHNKTHLSAHEQVTFIAGNSLTVQHLNGFSMGMHLCLESHYPELSLTYQKQGANLLSFAFASPRETPEDKLERFKMYLQARAYDNACFVMACNSTGKTPLGKEYAGAALIISPRGKVLAESKAYEPSYCVAEINMKDIHAIKNSAMSNFPAYRNTQINLEFNE